MAKIEQFSGVAEQFENKTNGFSFRIGGVKYSFNGNNIDGILEGDYVTGTFTVESFPDKKDPTRKVNWNKVIDVHKSQAPAGGVAPTPQAAHKQQTPKGGDFVFPIPPDNYQRSVVRRDALYVAQSNLGQGADRMEVLRLAKLFEAYCCGDFDLPSEEG